MNTLTINSVEILDEEMQLEVHYSLGMEHYTDYVFKPDGQKKYTATIVPDDPDPVIGQITSRSAAFPDLEFEIEVLDMESGSVERYVVRDGSLV